MKKGGNAADRRILVGQKGENSSLERYAQGVKRFLANVFRMVACLYLGRSSLWFLKLTHRAAAIACTSEK
jgi:hypothetical protein